MASFKLTVKEREPNVPESSGEVPITTVALQCIDGVGVNPGVSGSSDAEPGPLSPLGS